MAEAFSIGSMLLPMINSSSPICVSAATGSFTLNESGSPKTLKTWTFTKTIASAFALLYLGDTTIPFTTTTSSSLFFHAAVSGTTLSSTTSGRIKISDMGSMALLYSGTSLTWMAYSKISGSEGFESSCIIAWVSFTE